MQSAYDGHNRIFIPAALIALTVFLWSSAFVAIGALVETMPPVTIAAIRFLIASLCFIPVALRDRQLKAGGGIGLSGLSILPLLAGAGITGIFGYNVLLNIGQTRVDPATASLIVNVVPVLTFLFCCALGWERFAARRLLALCVCLGGVSLVIFSPLDGGADWSFWAVLIFGAAMCQALYFLLVRRLLDQMSPGMLTSLSTWIGAVMLLALAGPEIVHLEMTAREVMLLLYLGIGPTAIGFLSWSHVLSTMSASSASSFLFLVPLSSLLMAWFMLDRLPPGVSFIGGAAIIAGLWLFYARRTA